MNSTIIADHCICTSLSARHITKQGNYDYLKKSLLFSFWFSFLVCLAFQSKCLECSSVSWARFGYPVVSKAIIPWWYIRKHIKCIGTHINTYVYTDRTECEPKTLWSCQLNVIYLICQSLLWTGCCNFSTWHFVPY